MYPVIRKPSAPPFANAASETAEPGLQKTLWFRPDFQTVCTDCGMCNSLPSSLHITVEHSSLTTTAQFSI